jgi:CO/xanthine dehydrogenase FAD-binding subunit
LENTKYHAPATLDEALDLLKKFSGRCNVLAGGTDFVVDLNEKRIAPSENLIYLGNVSKMKFIREKDSALEIGAMVTHAELESDPLVHRVAPLISMAAESVGSPAIRSMGTIGGNIATASPAGDMSTALLAFDSQIIFKYRTESKKVPLKDFFIGPGQTLLKPDGLIYSISFPLPEVQSTGQTFMKLGKRVAMSCAIVSCATVATIDRSSGKLTDVKISLGSVSPKPMRALETEKFLKGKTPSESLYEKSGQIAMKECDPIDDIRGSALYRQEMVAVFVKRSLKEACHQVLNEK